MNWSNAGGADNNGGTSTADDVAIQQYVRTAGTNNRTIAIDANNDVWVGGFGNKMHQRIDGNTGATDPAFDLSPGGYGGLIDGNGVLWSSGWSTNRTARYDTINGVQLADAVTPNGGDRSYGLGIDSQGNVWNSHLNTRLSKFAPDGTHLGTFAGGGNGGRGVTVTPDDNVWVANSFSSTVSRFDNAGNLIKTIGVGSTPTGISVDSNGKVWVTNQGSNNVMRIDPQGGGDNKGAVELTVDLGAGARPYNYSDMTGSVVGGVTNPSGTWRNVVDSGMLGSLWDKIMWNQEAEGSIPAGTGIVVEARFADTLLDLGGATWASYGQMDDLTGMTGRFAEILVTLTRPGTPGAPTPVLSDLKLTTKTTVVPLPMPAWLLLTGLFGLFGAGRLRSRSS
ncbi:hypothetical protein D6850_06285 [Roseovarius spongiae]|uniref:Uncharacterized protein n=1 Tax=Roseovarius spongiae TaxID=2320272 RepID=A0A3A8AXD8_9RHOB|nr:hypothetical protein D6850_06285 [Roseovarius spongiae]